MKYISEQNKINNELQFKRNEYEIKKKINSSFIFINLNDYIECKASIKLNKYAFIICIRTYTNNETQIF